MLPLLKQSLERAQSQSTLVAIVTEGLSAAYMMTLMYGADIEAGKKSSGHLVYISIEETKLMLDMKIVRSPLQ